MPTAASLLAADSDENCQLVTRRGEDRRLTEQQSIFVSGLIKTGDITISAKLAGYAHPAQTGFVTSKLPHIQQAVRDGLARRLVNEALPLALNTLMEIAGNKKAPSAARVSAANSLLDRGGMISKAHMKQDDGKPKAIDEMSLDELDAFIAAGEKALSDRRDRLAIEGEKTQDNDQVIEQSP